MTKQEWIQNDFPFFHVTPTSNIPSILKNGLLRKLNPYGICVIRSNNPDVIEYLVQMMLWTNDETTFSIIEIKPTKHNLTSAEIINDHVVEATNPLHNYIKRNLLTIDQTDIIGSFEVIPNSITDFEEYANRLHIKGLIQSLD